MARTQAADYDDRRDRILDAAAALYAEAGFHGCSIADLAAACGMSKSLLYHYFSSKDDILFEIMAGHIGALGVVAAAVEDEPDPETRLRRLTRDLMALYVGASARHKVLVNDLGKIPAERRRTIVAGERALVDLVDRALAEISPHLADRAAERRAAAMLYFGMINWTHTWFDPEGPLDAGAVADLAAETFLKGLPRR